MSQTEKHDQYFVDFYVSFGEVARETFETWHAMQFFMRQLRPGALLAHGTIHLPQLPKAA